MHDKFMKVLDSQIKQTTHGENGDASDSHTYTAIYITPMTVLVPRWCILGESMSSLVVRKYLRGNALRCHINWIAYTLGHRK